MFGFEARTLFDVSAHPVMGALYSVDRMSFNGQVDIKALSYFHKILCFHMLLKCKETSPLFAMLKSSVVCSVLFNPRDFAH